MLNAQPGAAGRGGCGARRDWEERRPSHWQRRLCALAGELPLWRAAASIDYILLSFRCRCL
jgi:hypothetical protein